jgi:murein DD-endopeptidase MepM/ murein hydrolase activator NlpD
VGRAVLVLATLAVTATAGGAPALRVDVRARAIQPGELIVLTVDAPADAGPVRVRAFDRDVAAVPIDDGKWRALVGIDLDVKPGAYPLVVEAGALREARDLVVRAKAFRTRRLTVNPDFVTPPRSVEERIAREAELLRTAWRGSPPRALWSEPFTRPVDAAANSAFGTRSVFNGLPRNAHGGADFLSGAGTPVRAPNAGRVVVARDLYFSGNTVIIDHGAGLFSMLAHLSAFDVREGDEVRNGAVVGRVGATGRVTGPHLHWAVRASDARVDPLSLLALLGRRSGS